MSLNRSFTSISTILYESLRNEFFKSENDPILKPIIYTCHTTAAPSDMGKKENREPLLDYRRKEKKS